MTYKSFKFEEHDKYIQHQIDRHIATENRTAGRPHQLYINKIKTIFPEAKKILCVGARHISEVEAFTNNGFEALGIDLFSSNQEIIRLLDMHNIPEAFEENEFDLIFSCHSLEHSLHPDKVFRGFRKCAKIGAFIALPFQLEPNSKDPTVFSFMEAGGCKFKSDNPGEGVTKEMVQEDFNDLLEDNVTCEIADLVICPLRPNKDDGYWISVNWNK